VRLGTVLVPVDRRPASLDALEAAARLRPEEIFLVHVIQPFDAIVPQHLYQGIGGPRSLLEEERVHAAKDLERLARCVRPRRIACRTEVRAGVPWEEILAAASGAGADLIVMATAGRTGLPRFLLGSVTEKVVRAADCPVMTIRSPAKHPTTITRDDDQPAIDSSRASTASRGSSRPAVVSARKTSPAGSSSGRTKESRRAR
jgi:nucleotide-binding universal stress UspA family protein